MVEQIENKGKWQTMLTKRQQEIYQYLLNHRQEFSHPPSLDELCQAMGVKSRGSMHKHVQALIKAGLVKPFNGQKRGIQLTNAAEIPAAGLVSLPLLGKIAAGIPFEAIENPETLVLPRELTGNGECYVLTVKGDSMMDAGIHDGDWVVIEKTTQVRNGDIVVALIDNTEATLKRFEKTDDLIILSPENTRMKPMIFNPNRVRIQGRLVAKMRRYA